MLSSSRASALRHYRSSGSAAAICDVSQHHVIVMLYNGALESLGRAQAAMKSGDTKARLKSVRSATEVLGYLRGILNLKAGGKVAASLAELYDYMIVRLTRANAMNDAEGLNEVSRLICEIKAGWEAIPQDKRY
jgi:flagellar protein FliS